MSTAEITQLCSISRWSLEKLSSYPLSLHIAGDHSKEHPVENITLNQTANNVKINGLMCFLILKWINYTEYKCAILKKIKLSSSRTLQ